MEISEGNGVKIVAYASSYIYKKTGLRWMLPALLQDVRLFVGDPYMRRGPVLD